MGYPAGFEGVRRSEAVRVWLLGGFRVSVGSRTITQDAWRLRKAAALVKLLALAPSHRLHREQAMDLLWPDSGRRAASNSLRSTLHAARKVLDPTTGPRYLASEEESLVLCPEGNLSVDVEAFEEAAANARRSREPAAYRAAIELYAGDLLPEDRYEAWTESRREELRQLYFASLIALARLYEESGEHGPAVEVLREAVLEEATLEEAHAGLMRLYALSGRPERALAQYERFRDILSSEFGMQPGASTRLLHDEIAAGTFLPNRPSAEGVEPQENETSVGIDKHNLPTQRTSFVGRGRMMLEVKRALPMTRLLTLTGAGGSGKSRLAFEVAKDLVWAYQDGVWLVELAPLSDGTLVSQAVAEALKVTEQPGQAIRETLAEALSDKAMLLLLDNCEHLVETCARLADALLNSCPHLTILATSREPLGVNGEAVWRVSPLSAPGTNSPSAEDLMGYDAARLFLDRARLRLPDFDLTRENAAVVAEVCRRLEGLPLAIELATARMGALGVKEIAERLEDSLRLLSTGPRTVPPRQQTMRATLEWSHELLPEPERVLFRHLSVFAGGWTLEAAEAMAYEGGGWVDIMDLHGRLVDKSLVTIEVSPGVDEDIRYRMLEPVRQYAQEKLDQSGEADVAKGRHAAFFLALAEEAEPELKGPRQGAWLSRLAREHDNFRSALGWLLERDEAQSLRLVAASGEFWHMRGHLSEGRRWLEIALARWDTPSPARVKVLAKAGWIAWEQTDLQESVAFSQEGLALAREMENEAGIASLLINLGVATMLQGELVRASESFEESLPLLRKLGEEQGLSLALLGLGDVAMIQGDYGRATALMEESLASARESGDVYKTLLALNHLGLVALLQGEYGRAERLCKENLRVSRGSGMGHLIALSVHILAASAGAQGRLVRSARLWGATEAMREAVGTTFSPAEYEQFNPYIMATRDRMGEAAWEVARAEGRVLTAEEAVEYALSTEEWALEPASTVPEAPSAGRVPNNLTRREREVAGLVARGLTNRQIATELSISEHTVANHVAKMMRKLGVDSRSQLTAWVLERWPVP